MYQLKHHSTNSLRAPTQVFQECWSGTTIPRSQPPPPPRKCKFGQILALWVVGLSWSLMFSQACVKNSVHRREVYTPLGKHPPGQTPSLGRHPSWADTPLANTPRADTPFGETPPLGRHPSWAYTPLIDTPRADTPFGQTPPLGRHPLWADIPWADTPLGRHSPRQTPSPPSPLSRWALKRECILLYYLHSKETLSSSLAFCTTSTE